MTSVLLPLLIAFYIGYQVDENKMKQYEMINESGQILVKGLGKVLVRND